MPNAPASLPPIFFLKKPFCGLGNIEHVRYHPAGFPARDSSPPLLRNPLMGADPQEHGRAKGRKRKTGVPRDLFIFELLLTVKISTPIVLTFRPTYKRRNRHDRAFQDTRYTTSTPQSSLISCFFLWVSVFYPNRSWSRFFRVSILCLF